MLSAKTLTLVTVAALAWGGAARAAAQCTLYDFEDLAVGTVVSSQYDGVTFSVVGQSCSGTPTIYLRIANQFLGDAFGSKVLLIDGGCPDFSSDYMRMVFDLPQREVRFTLGPWYGNYTVRAYSTTSGGSPISTQSITIPGSGFTGCHRQVRVISTTGNIRRVEVQEAVGQWEAIDDLAFNLDDTPPVVEIETPTVMDCVSGSVLLRGISCDSDGMYDHDVLEYLRVYPASGTDWTLVDTATTPVCATSALYYWSTTGLAEGLYMLRITATNACGLSSSAVTTVYLDQDFDNVTVGEPVTGGTRGGTVCFDGTVWDEVCFDHYVVEYQPLGGGAWQPVDPLHVTYTTPIVNEHLADWATAGVVADGSYVVRVVGTTGNNKTLTRSMNLIIDNTAPVAVITKPTTCRVVSGTVPIVGTASDANLYEWHLDYYVPATRIWQSIAVGNTSVVNGTLANWATSARSPCYYTLRLRVWDDTILDGCGSSTRRYAEQYLAVAVGDVPCRGDVNGDGAVNWRDIDPFIALMNTTCP